MTLNNTNVYYYAKMNDSSSAWDMYFNQLNGSEPFDISKLYEYYFDAGLLANQIEGEINFDFSPLSVVQILLYSVVFLTGLLGNIFVIVVIIKFKSMRTVTNVFLVNLTIGDILVILICVPLTLGNTVYRKWIYGSVMCKLTPFVQGTVIGVSISSLLAISISRYFAIYKPLTAKIVFSKRNVRILLFFIWVASLGSFSPLLYVTSVTSYGIPGIFENIVCEEKWNSIDDKNIYNLFVFSILFVFPFLMMGIAYTVISYTLWYSNAALFDNDSMMQAYKKTHLILRQRRRTVKLLICIVSVFGICWLPYYCVNLWIDFNIEKYRESVAMETIVTYVYPFVLLLGLGNSAVNPICYFLLSRGFKRGFRKIFCFTILRRRSSFLLSSLRMKNSSGSESIETADM